MKRNVDLANQRRQQKMAQRGRVWLKNSAQKRVPLPLDARTSDAIVVA